MQGQMTPREAVDDMLAGANLTAAPASGVYSFAVRRALSSSEVTRSENSGASTAACGRTQKSTHLAAAVPLAARLCLCLCGFLSNAESQVLRRDWRALDETSGDAAIERAGIPRRLIAIDNRCAWPNLVTLRDGTIVAIVFNQPNHGMTEGDVECWASQDGGLTWSFRSTVTRHAPNTVRMNVAAGLNREGELIVLCSGWDNIAPQRGRQSRPLETVGLFSSDNGATWEQGGKLPPPVDGLSHHVPFGDIVIAQNGDLVAGTYVFDATWESRGKGRNRRGEVYALRSSDGGRTWGEAAVIADTNHVEAAILHLGRGRWLSASRRFGDLDLDLHASDDDARSWHHVKTLGIPRVSAAHLLQLSDGRVLLAYGNRSPGNYGLDVRLGSDEGKAWSAPQRLINFESRDNGYPETVQLSDGRLLIAYYAHHARQHGRYHMGILNLSTDELHPE